MATATTLDAVCACGHTKACHRSALQWGQKVPTSCRHCLCAAYADVDQPARAADREVLTSYEAHACRSCGARYGQPYDDHACGPLTPVVVTVTALLDPAAR